MSWLSFLNETYNQVASQPDINQGLELYFHKNEKCHIEVVLDQNGKFKRARSLVRCDESSGKKKWDGENTLIPITPKSLTGRTSGAAPYPLAEKLHYLAPDYPALGGTKKSYYKEYLEQLSAWCRSIFSHPKAEAVFKYVSKGELLRDLINSQLVYVYKSGKDQILVSDWKKQVEDVSGQKKPDIFYLTGLKDQGQIMVRWAVEMDEEPDSTTWNDDSLHNSWIEYEKEVTSKHKGFCQVLGIDAYITDTHPKGIVQTKDANGAKLISSPTDKTYLTYQGRFISQEQACSISFEVSQKAHNALRWLLHRQGQFIGSNSMLVAWAISGKAIPSPLAATADFDLDDFGEVEGADLSTVDVVDSTIDHSIDLGQSFAAKLTSYMRGYRAKLSDTDQISIMAIDSATPGRMGITYYRETLPEEYIDRITQWHTDLAWPQRILIDVPQKKGKPKQKVTWPISAPSPYTMLQVVYGDVIKINESLKKNFYERLIPCVLEGRSIPFDLVKLSVAKASDPVGQEHWEWERSLGVACSLFRGFYLRHPCIELRRDFAMSLDTSNTSRDYLYGRLLALAERIEEVALRAAGVNRPSTANRLMQRFSARPYETWLTIYKQLDPYIRQMKVSRPGFLTNINRELDTVMSLFDRDEFISSKALSGEFLLGFHCQRLALNNKSETSDDTNQHKNTEEHGS